MFFFSSLFYRSTTQDKGEVDKKGMKENKEEGMEELVKQGEANREEENKYCFMFSKSLAFSQGKK